MGSGESGRTISNMIGYVLGVSQSWTNRWTRWFEWHGIQIKHSRWRVLVALVASCSGCTTSLSHLKCCWCFSFGKVRIIIYLISGETVNRFTQPSTVVQNKLSIINSRTDDKQRLDPIRLLTTQTSTGSNLKTWCNFMELAF